MKLTHQLSPRVASAWFQFFKLKSKATGFKICFQFQLAPPHQIVPPVKLGEGPGVPWFPYQLNLIIFIE
jgi:hypothetical protein